MREININIEGFNVNGICVGCLNYNRAMFYHPAIKECFAILGNIEVPDGLAVQVCWECLAYVKNAMRFRNQMIASCDFLLNYSKEHMFLESPNKIALSARTRLNTSDINHDSYSETVLSEDHDNIEIKIDIPIKEEFSTESNYEEFPTFDYLSSEDDVLLSKLKRKDKSKSKKKKGKKKKMKNTSAELSEETKDLKTETKDIKDKKSRKLKSLPEDLVELVTMTVEDMYKIRTEDLMSKEFQKIKHKCNDCVIGFNSEKLMNDHFNGKHQPKGEASHFCDICKSYYRTGDHLSTHKQLHRNAFSCTQCDFVTSLKRRMKRHVVVHNVELAEFTCSLCGDHFSTRSMLNYHRGVCKQENPQCDCCGKVFANKMTLKYHLKVVSQALNNTNKPKENLYIPCKGCDKVFQSKKSYSAHVVIHDGITYPCPTCGKQFQWKRNLARHTRAHRDRDAGHTHHCRTCGKDFASRDCYNNHMKLSKRHVPEDTYQHECNYCNKKFATKWCLTDHIDWDHLKRIKYQCNVCFKPFKTAKILVAHTQNVHGDKKSSADDGEHLCDICGKSYKTEKRLKGHVWSMHTKRSNSKSFKCKYCPATFTWQTSIYKHVKMMHEPKKTKLPRTIVTVPVKKEESYPGTELPTRMQYFHQNMNNLNVIHLQPMVTQNVI